MQAGVQAGHVASKTSDWKGKARQNRLPAGSPRERENKYSDKQDSLEHSQFMVHR